MFRHRTNSQKPDENLYAAFKQSFPGIGPGAPSTGPGPVQRSSSLSDAPATDLHLPNRYALSTRTPPACRGSLSTALTIWPCDTPLSRVALAKDVDDIDHDAVLINDFSSRHFAELEDTKEHDATPKGVHDQWRFTPSLMDPNSFAFSAFANQPPGYYTPTPGGLNTLYHSQAGDLHTPGMGMNLGTPLSLPQTSNILSATNPHVSLHHYQPHLLQPHQFEHIPNYAPQQVFGPSFLQHKDSGYEAMSQSPHDTPAKAEMGMLPGPNMSIAQSAESGMAIPAGSMGNK
jgi:hypothetical protein